ncbi:MAG: FAD-binding protein [Deltaproteobacteria bacterium]|nr:FAD-binding protein [Deltaproteobacteria bacterium]
MEKIRGDILIIGMGGAASLAALNAYDANPESKIIIVTKDLRGKGGCSRMVQGGFNVVLNDEDSHEKHLMDTLNGGKFINNQDLAVQFVEEATPTIKEMETIYGCFFDRNPDGTIHQKPFAGQTFDRTVHKGDLTGIEIISRTTEQISKRNITMLEEHRALELLTDASGKEVVGALVLDVRRGIFKIIEAAVTFDGSGGGTTNYRFFAPGPPKTQDGLGMMYRAGVRFIDMEMVQFHPTGLIVPGSVVAGALLEEGLRGAGAYILNRNGERFMSKYDPERMERTTRDIMSRSSFIEMMEGRACDHGGVCIVASHLGAERVERDFPGMCERCALFGYDLARKPVPVSPSAHYLMGGAVIDMECKTSLERLFCAGEDSGGMHGANRLGGNGIADSCVYGRLAGKAMARYLKSNKGIPESRQEQVDEFIARYMEPFDKKGGISIYDLRHDLREINWTKIGVARTGEKLKEAITDIEEIRQKFSESSVKGGKAYNTAWNDWISLQNMISTSTVIGGSAILREETRGAHYRLDYPKRNDDYGLFNIYAIKGEDGKPVFEKKPVELKYKKPSDLKK